MENDSVLYVGISTFSLSQVDCDSVVDAIHQAERDSVPFLIFDVRNNYGGDAGVQARITRALLGRIADRPHTSYQKVNAALFKSPTMNWPEGDTIFAGFKPIEGRKGLYLMEEEEDNAKISTIDSLGYNGRLYVLIDSRSASASAFLAGAVKRNDRGYVVGRETMSAYHCETCIKFANISLPNSQFTATIPMVRVVIDETVSDRLPALRGVIPDCDIPMTEAEFHYDGDYILDRTLQLIAEGTYLEIPEGEAGLRKKALIFAPVAIGAVALLFLLFRLRRNRRNEVCSTK
jgi:C-terminal processing protease CtpA/Prc